MYNPLSGKDVVINRGVHAVWRPPGRHGEDAQTVCEQTFHMDDVDHTLGKGEESGHVICPGCFGPSGRYEVLEKYPNLRTRNVPCVWPAAYDGPRRDDPSDRVG